MSGSTGTKAQPSGGSMRAPKSKRLPVVVYALAAGIFLMGATEFLIAGLLPQMAADLAVSESTVGLLVTAFAAGMIVGSPVMAVLTLRLPRAAVVALVLGVFAVGHAAMALSSDFPLLVAARVLTAFATGAFWAVASVVAAEAAGPAARARALGVLGGGMTLAMVFGVPLGSWIGHVAGWRIPFWILAGAAAVAAVVIPRFVPDQGGTASSQLAHHFAALRQGRLWLPLAAAALIMGGVLSCYSYIGPLLIDRAGLAASAVPLVLVGFGIGALAGTTAGGRFGDAHPKATAVTGAAAATAVLCALTVLGQHPAYVVTLTILLGVSGYTVNPIVTALVVRFAASAPMLASAVTVSAFNTGIAIGSALAGLALASPMGTAGPSAVGAVITALTVLPLAMIRTTSMQ